MAKKKIKVSDKEKSLIDTMNENMCKGQMDVEVPEKEVYADAYPNVETENETLCSGKGCINTHTEPEVLKPIEEEIPIDYVDTSKPYVPNLPEPELYINEDNRDSRIATTIDTTKDELIKSKDIAKDIIENKKISKFDYYTHIMNKFPELRDEFCKKVIPISKDLCNRLDEISKPLEPQCGSTNGKTIAIYDESPDKCKVALEEQILKCLDIMRGNSTDAPADDKGSIYEEVNHPDHYNVYDVEVVDMMERIFGIEETMSWCKLNAFKYRMRAGEKPTSTVEKDLKKEKWCLNKYKELKNKIHS